MSHSLTQAYGIRLLNSKKLDDKGILSSKFGGNMILKQAFNT